jgi:hypothetical protein
MCDNLSKNLKAKVLGAAVEGGAFRRAGDKRGVKDVAADKEIVHPFTTGEGGHDLSGVGDVVGIGKSGFLFTSADLLSI